jgi:Protein of unknown function (DUF3224)
VVGQHVAFVQACHREKRYTPLMQAKGTFEVQVTHEPPVYADESFAIGRHTVAKQFAGELAGDSVVYMTSVGRPGSPSGAYVAVERVRGTLNGKHGTFALHHVGVRSPESQRLTIEIVTDSGGGELAGIAGTLTIEIVEKQHHYTIDYLLP